jgi:adenine-specific DNA-methyltransferase
VPGEVAVWPIDQSGREKVWTCSAARLVRELDDVKVTKSDEGGIEIQKKYRPHQDGALPGTWWDASEYSASESGTKVLKDLFGAKKFDYPKSINLVIDNLRVLNAHRTSLTLDYFAGSATTACAVIALNREDQASRKYVLAEQGSYFDSVAKPRVQKVVYAPDWRDGRPINPQNGMSHAFKVITIESYEDAINNLDIRRHSAQRSLLEAESSEGADRLKEQYLLRYMLNVETRGSQSLLNFAAFTDPTAYMLKVKRPGNNESREVNVDLLETFNWLIGLKVRHIAAPQTFHAVLKRDEEGRLRLDGRLRQDEAGAWWFRTVDGETLDGRKTLVIWRKLTGDGERDNLVLDEWFTRQGYSTKDYEFDLIYVNGDNNLENLRKPDETWKVRLTEEDFHRLMFDVENV